MPEEVKEEKKVKIKLNRPLWNAKKGDTKEVPPFYADWAIKKKYAKKA